MSREEEGKLAVVCIGSWNNGASEDDEEYLSESLLRTIDGTYHLYCEGGEMTYYSQFEDRVDVKELTMSEAKAWAVSHGLVSTVEKCFADVA